MDKIALNFKYLAWSQGTIFLFGTIFQLILAKILSISEFGIFQQFIVYSSFLVTLFSLGLNNVIWKYSAKIKNKKIIVSFFLKMFFVISLASIPFLYFFNSYIGNFNFFIFSLFVLLSLLSLFFNSFFYGIEKLEINFKVLFFSYITKFLLLFLIFFLFGLNLFNLLVLILICQIFSSVFYFYFLNKLHLKNQNGNLNTISILKESLFIYPHSLVSSLFPFLLILLLQIFYSSYEIGIIQLYILLSSLAISVSSLIIQSIFPSLSKKFNFNIFSSFFKISFLSSIFFQILFFSFSYYILNFLKHEYLNAIEFLGIFILASIFYFCFNVFATLLFLKNKLKENLFSWILFLILFLIFFFSLNLNVYLKVSLSFLISSLISSFVSFKFCNFHFKINYKHFFVFPFLFIFLLYPNLFFVFVSLVFSIFCFKFLLNKKEVKIVFELIKRFFV